MRKFIKRWVKGKSVAEVAQALGISVERAWELAARCRRNGLGLRILPEETQNILACCQGVRSATEMEAAAIESATGLQLSSPMRDFLAESLGLSKRTHQSHVYHEGYNAN